MAGVTEASWGLIAALLIAGAVTVLSLEFARGPRAALVVVHDPAIAAAVAAASSVLATRPATPQSEAAEGERLCSHGQQCLRRRLLNAWRLPVAVFRDEQELRPVQSKICVPLFAARTLNATGQPRVTQSLR